ncbi:uncharacterized protein LOC117816976 [Notolabrus celidotus]|uniref:uncharacterized protein LOC117816976 n=1 Tax=Notolabrus celidotus TaxID=1203425 RepID=UPI00149043D5|nr:uncharacterized protein LOC117816976 [Notolabrus celidotus]
MLSFFGIILLLIHKEYALVTVMTVQLGEPGTLTCLLPDFEYSNARIKWYKQSTGDTLVLMNTQIKGTKSTTFEERFRSSRFNVNCTGTTSTLTILKTIPEDEAMYHCAITTWSEDHWSATILSIEEKIQRTSNFTVFQRPRVSHPVHPADLIRLKCSLLIDSQRTTCPSDHSVHLFGVGPDKSDGNIIYTDRNKYDDCDKKSDLHSTPKSCVYHFSKNVSSSDDGTYYCAVATCGEILFEKGTKLDIEVTGSSPSSQISIILLVSFVVLVTSMVLLAIHKCDYCNDKAAVALQENVAERTSKRDEDPGFYSAVIFTMVKTSSGGTRDEYSADGKRI